MKMMINGTMCELQKAYFNVGVPTCKTCFCYEMVVCPHVENKPRSLLCFALYNELRTECIWVKSHSEKAQVSRYERRVANRMKLQNERKIRGLK